MKKPGEEKHLLHNILKTWPALPYLGLGLCLAWLLMAFSGGVWLSDVETDGQNISKLYLTTCLGLGTLCIVAALANKQFTRMIESRAALVAAGGAGALGAFLIIIAGPYYLYGPLGFYAEVMFCIGGVLAGLAIAFLILKCGQLYSRLAPRKVLIYVALSQALVSCSYFVVLGLPRWPPVSGGPFLSGIIAFVLFLPAAAVVLTLGEGLSSAKEALRSPKGVQEHDRPHRSGDGLKAGEFVGVAGNQKSGEPPAAIGSRKAGESLAVSGNQSGGGAVSSSAGQGRGQGFRLSELPAAFWRFLVMLLLFSLVVSMIRAVAVDISPVETTFAGTSIAVLFRLAFAFLVILVAMSRGVKRINFGKIYSFIALVLVVVIAMLPMIEGLNSSLNIIISCAQMIFEIVLFCLLVFICYQRRIPYTVAVGFGYGLYTSGSAFGWMIGASNPLASFDPQLRPVFYLIVAGIIMVLAFILYSERDFDRLFSALSASETTLQSVLEAADESPDEESTIRHGQGSFITMLNELAEESGLTPREVEVFRCLAMGRGTDYTARYLSISWNTVRTHTHNIYTKLGVHSRGELMDRVDRLRR